MNGLFFYFGMGLLLAYLESSWWFIILILGASPVLSVWNRWRRVTSNLTPEQSLGEVIALLRIRSAEIGAIYTSIRNYQKSAENDPWIPIFIAEYRSISSYSVYQEECGKREKKYRNNAHALYAKRFSYDPFYGLLNEIVLADIGVAMLCWVSGIDSTIRLLKSIRCDANLSLHVCALIREYQLIRFLTLDGNYHVLFKNWRPLSSLVRDRYHLLLQLWEEVWRAHQNIILIAQASGQFKAPSYLEEAWVEGQSLAGMEKNLRRALSQENTRSHGAGGKDEQSFFQYLKSNPIWLKLYKYNSPSEYDPDLSEKAKIFKNPPEAN